MDLLDLLDEILDAENLPTVSVNPDRRAPIMLPCGVHEAWREDDAHVAACWGGVCPSCGDEVQSGFLYRLNHQAAEHGVCGSIILRLNHLTASMRGMTYTPSVRDLEVLSLGYRIGPDGSQVHPDGRVDPCLPPHLEAELVARWA